MGYTYMLVQLGLCLLLMSASAVWIPPKPQTAHGNKLLQGQYVLRRSKLVSQDGSTVLRFNRLGNLELIRDGSVVWAQGGSEWMQTAVDIPLGVLEFRSPEGTFRFEQNYTDISKKVFPNRLVVQNDGDAVIYDSDNQRRWATNTRRPEGGPLDGDTTAYDWEVPNTYVAAPEDPLSYTRSRCPVSTVDAPGLDGAMLPPSSFTLCPPCAFITSMRFTTSCDLSGLVSFTCSDNTTHTIQGTAASGDVVDVQSDFGFSAAQAGAVLNTPSIPGLVHVVFTPYSPPSSAVFAPPPPPPVEIADPYATTAEGPVCDPAELYEEGSDLTKARRDLNRVTCGPKSLLVGARAEVGSDGKLFFSVVCGVVDPAPLPLQENPCGPNQWYNTDTQKCYQDNCPSGQSLYTCGPEVDKHYCLSNVGVLCEIPYVLYDKDDKPIAFVCDQPLPCEVSGLCSYTRVCYPKSYGVIRDCDYIPDPVRPQPEPAFNSDETSVVYLSTYRDLFVQPTNPLGPRFGGTPDSPISPPTVPGIPSPPEDMPPDIPNPVAPPAVLEDPPPFAYPPFPPFAPPVDPQIPPPTQAPPVPTAPSPPPPTYFPQPEPPAYQAQPPPAYMMGPPPAVYGAPPPAIYGLPPVTPQPPSYTNEFPPPPVYLDPGSPPPAYIDQSPSTPPDVTAPPDDSSPPPLYVSPNPSLE